MNAHQRRKHMTRKHRIYPLDSLVLVNGKFKAHVFKHDRYSPQRMLIRLNKGTPQERVLSATLWECKPLQAPASRPWYRELKRRLKA